MKPRLAPLRSYCIILLPDGSSQSVAAYAGSLSRPLEDYFLGIDLAEWFSQTEQWKKNKVRAEHCAICGNPNPSVHEIQSKGAGGSIAALVPWNMLSVCEPCHRMLHARKWIVESYDPLADELVVMDAVNGIRVA